MTDAIYLGSSKKPQSLLLKYANRHGLVTGATGTGKTVTLQVMAEEFSAAGVPVFTVDIKGDLSGIAKVGVPLPHFVKRAEEIGYTLNYAAKPAIFWDVFAKDGHALRVTISEMGPLLLARLLELNETQSGVLDIVFAVADAEKLWLLDLDDLRALLNYVSENAKEFSKTYGLISPTTINAISRALLRLEQQGGKELFGEPALNLSDIMRTSADGKGIISVLTAEHLMQRPKLYATFMLWLLTELFEQLPEVGDLPKPRLVFFFDEAHLLFDDAPKVLTEKIEQLVRLIRSKGVGVYFITQNPADVPEGVLAQLGNRIQHALRAYTPQEQKAVRAAAQSFRANPEFSTEEVITSLGVGEALVSTLDEKATPSMVERTFIRPPNSFVGPLSDTERTAIKNQSPVLGMYDNRINRESANELLAARTAQTSATMQGAEPQTIRVERHASSGTGRVVASVVTSVIRSIGTQVARDLTRNFLKTLRK